MRFDLLTIFPEMFSGPMTTSILGRAQEAGHISVHTHDLRDWTTDRHRTVDDAPFGGGPGMLMKPEPLFAAVEAIQPLDPAVADVVLLTPQGRPLTRDLVGRLAQRPRLLLICGRYEGVDERVREHLVDLEVSAADVVLSGGELPAMLLVDAVARRLPGVLGSERSLDEESFDGGLLEYPQYTRPQRFRDWEVPEVLLSGHHENVQAWRQRQRLLRTASRRPDLLAAAPLTAADRAVLREWERERGEGSASLPPWPPADTEHGQAFEPSPE